MMMHKITALREQLDNATITDAASLEAFRCAFIGKKGPLAALFEAFKAVPASEKKELGAALNRLKNAAEERFKQAAKTLDLQDVSKTKQEAADVTLPSFGPSIGSLHPLRIVQNKLVALFERIGFNLTEGPEIVGDWHNFGALNFAQNHPARDMQDTFFLQRNPDQLLRTHTTSVQIATCAKKDPPIRSISVGRVFRNEAISARSHCFFHQLDGMYVHTDVTFKALKETIYYLVEEVFGKETNVRFRASYFPFTEPSAEVDISCQLCQGSECSVCKQSGWVEILGAGMIDPNVLQNCQIDPKQYSGFAFGMGIERIAMLLYRIDDLRLFSENHLDFLSQFKAAR